jgi:WD40 repeat protein
MPADSRLRPIAFPWHTKLDDFITTLAWSPDGAQLAVASVAGQVGLYDPAAGRTLHLIERAHDDGCDALAWHPDGNTFATAGRDGTWRLWNAAEGSKLAEHEAGAIWPEHLAWSPQPVIEGKHWLALGAGALLSLWDDQGQRVREPLKFSRTISDLAWVGGKPLVAVATSTGIIWRDAVGEKDERRFESKDSILNMSLSPSSRWLMTGNQDCSVHVWNTETKTEMHMRGYATKVRQMAWHRGSRWLATGGGPAVSVWDCSGRGPEGRTPTMLAFHEEPVSALRYQPAGDWLASGARDGGVAFWSPTQRQQLLGVGKITSGVTRLAWSPNGRCVAAGGEAGEISLLALD